MRLMYIFGNWKMYLSHEQAKAHAQAIAGIEIPAEAAVAVFPDVLSLVEVRDSLTEADVALGAQNVAWVPQGAYTGATSAALVSEVGCEYALVGHSERRHIFGETNDAVRKKLEACLDAGITPVLCIGETAEDKEHGKQEYRLKKQLMKALDGLVLRDNQLIVAYEPVWAISQGGKGMACEPADVAKTHAWLKEEVKQYTDACIPLLYGGSTNPENVVGYTSLEDVDGVLVGHASTDAARFEAMVRAVHSS